MKCSFVWNLEVTLLPGPLGRKRAFLELVELDKFLVGLKKFLVEQVDSQSIADSSQLSDVIADLLDGFDLFGQELGLEEVAEMRILIR